MDAKREPWHRWLGRRLDLMAASAVGTLAVVLVGRQFAYVGFGFDPFMTIGAAALPIACLIARPSLLSMLGVVMTGFPCCIFGSFYCDITSAAATGGLLHEVEGYLLYLPLYGMVRALHLGLTKP